LFSTAKPRCLRLWFKAPAEGAGADLRFHSPEFRRGGCNRRRIGRIYSSRFTQPEPARRSRKATAQAVGQVYDLPSSALKFRVDAVAEKARHPEAVEWA
jgi:hypothetical protein